MNILDAFYNTVHDAAGGVEALAPRMGMSAAILRNKANPNTATNKPSFDDADRLMGITSDFRPLAALAANHGFVLVKVEDEATSSDMAVLEMMTRCWATNGEFGLEVNKALADGRIEKHEIPVIRDRLLQNIQAMHQLVARLEGMAEK